MKKPKRTSVPVQTSLLGAVDRGQFAAAIEYVNANPATEALDEVLLRAEVALYLDRLDEAEEFLASFPNESRLPLDDPSEIGSAARRALLVEAGVQYARGRFDATLDLASRARAAARNASDGILELRSAYDQGRAARRLGRDEEAAVHLAHALSLADALGNEYFAGLIAFNRAQVANDQAVSPEITLDLTMRAISLLERSERLRFHALCQNFYGGLLADLGRIEEALALCESAEATASRLGLLEDTLRAANNRARALLSLKRYEEAIESLTKLVDWERVTGSGFTEYNALSLLAIAHYAVGRYDESRRCAEAALQVAKLALVERDVFDAELLLHRVLTRLAPDRRSEIAKMRALRERAERSGTDIQRLAAAVFLSQLVVEDNPFEARQLCTAARKLPIFPASGWLKLELERVEHDLDNSPVTIDANGRFVIDLTKGWPNRRRVMDVVDEYLFRHSVAACSGNLSAAGRLIGETPFTMFAMKRAVQGQLVRPSRARVQPGGKKTAKRRIRRKP
jgi:tetratricopeptide (TPR) repeat protein